MNICFEVDHLDVDRLLAEWRWLCVDPMVLIARSNFGDLFLRDQSGKILKLDLAVGRLSGVAESEEQFIELSKTKEKREEWFAESDAQAAAARGLCPGPDQCIGFGLPLVFAESGSAKPYIAGIYEHLSFLGDL